MPSTKQSKKVLVTGGLGFIGSHTVTDLHSKGYTPIIVDNLDNSYIKTLGSLEEICGEKLSFYNGDCSNKEVLRTIAEKEGPIWGCIHFAANKAVGESVENPLKYYRNNIGTLVSLLDESKNLGFEKFVFSSSCTVYGQPDTLPVDELAPIKLAESPYGYTKQVCERIISDFTATDTPIQFTLLRYFNPIGAHPSAKIGEWPIGTPNNLVTLHHPIGHRKTRAFASFRQRLQHPRWVVHKRLYPRYGFGQCPHFGFRKPHRQENGNF